MSNLDRDLIRHKLATIGQYLAKLEVIDKRGKQAFLESDIHFEAERFIELVVGFALDINFHFLSVLNLPAPAKYRDLFLELGKAKVLAYDLATRLAGSAGLRNLLVHNYGEIDLDRLYDGLKVASPTTAPTPRQSPRTPSSDSPSRVAIGYRLASIADRRSCAGCSAR